MPRNPNNPTEFIAGSLPKIDCNGKTYFVDGRLKELRNVNDFMEKPDIDDSDFYSNLTPKARKVIHFEFYGIKL